MWTTTENFPLFVFYMWKRTEEWWGIFFALFKRVILTAYHVKIPYNSTQKEMITNSSNQKKIINYLFLNIF